MAGVGDFLDKLLDVGLEVYKIEEGVYVDETLNGTEQSQNPDAATGDVTLNPNSYWANLMLDSNTSGQVTGLSQGGLLLLGAVAFAFYLFMKHS